MASSSYVLVDISPKLASRLKECLRLRLKNLDNERPLNVAGLYDEIAVICAVLGDFQTATMFQKKLIKLLNNENKPNQSNIGNVFYEMACCYNQMENCAKEALKYHKLALDTRLKLKPSKKTVESLMAVADMYTNMGLHKKSLEYKEYALQILTELDSTKDELFAKCLDSVGSSWGNLMHRRRALKMKTEALQVREEIKLDQSQVNEYYVGNGCHWLAKKRVEKIVKIEGSFVNKTGQDPLFVWNLKDG